MIIFLLVGACIFGYLLYYKPEYVAVLLFMLIISNVNIDINALPLNTRAIITLALFGRILIGPNPNGAYPQFVQSPTAKLLILFLVYILFIAFSQGLFTIELIKQDISVLLSTYFVYYYYLRDKNYNIIRWGMILAGLVCFSDLVYTYTAFGSFPVQRLAHLLPGSDPLSEEMLEFGENNHNFYGQICGMAFVFVVTDYINNRKMAILNILLLPLMFMGVLMSTSRSALLGMILVFLLVILMGVSNSGKMKRVYKIGGFSVGAIAAVIILFMTLSTYFKLDSEFLDSITERLVDEPLAVLNKSLGNNYDINSLSSMDWRGEAAADAYGEYLKLDLNEQFFGVGPGGFIARDMGHGLNPHNGILLILIENGILGFLIYLIIILGVIFNAFMLKNISPSLATLAFIIIYALGQNKELTSITTFLFVFTVVAENQYLMYENFKARLDKKKQRKLSLSSAQGYTS